MKEILEQGKVCKFGEVLFVHYRTSPVESEENIFYLNTTTGTNTNFFYQSVTQWHWAPHLEVAVDELRKIVLEAEEVIDCIDDNDIWFVKRMKDVLKLL